MVVVGCGGEMSSGSRKNCKSRDNCKVSVQEAGVDLCHQLLERTKLMQTVFEDWCSPHFEEGNIAVQWKVRLLQKI